jgi:hypothetical protein
MGSEEEMGLTGQFVSVGGGAGAFGNSAEVGVSLAYAARLRAAVAMTRGKRRGINQEGWESLERTEPALRPSVYVRFGQRMQ